jgi:hypothetical protein
MPMPSACSAVPPYACRVSGWQPAGFGPGFGDDAMPEAYDSAGKWRIMWKAGDVQNRTSRLDSLAPDTVAETAA